ncbi:MAG: hemolysin family protein [Chitinophagaceae bacterium]
MTELFIILGLIIMNGLFSMVEIALVSSRKVKLETQAAKGDVKAKAALALANRPDTFLSTVQIGITLIGILTGIFSGEHMKADFIDFFGSKSLTAPYKNVFATTSVVIIITYLSLVIGELVPKRIGLSNPEGIAKAAAAPMRIVMLVTYPFIWLLSASTTLLVKLLNLKANDSQVTEEEIKAIINEGTEHGAIEEAEQEIIERVFHLGDRNITSLMTHRSDIIWLDITQTVSTVKAFDGDRVKSVYPACAGSIDHIKGVVTLKDVFKADENTSISALVKPAMYVPENNTAYQVLEKFKATKVHHAFIVDEYGTLQGIITLNDILEAIVGDIPEQHEDNYEIVSRDDGSYLVDAQIPFYDFLSNFEKTEWLEDEAGNYDTLAGFILHYLQRIPATADKLHWRGFDFEIIDMDGHRIDKILVRLSDELKKDMD